MNEIMKLFNIYYSPNKLKVFSIPLSTFLNSVQDFDNMKAVSGLINISIEIMFL